MAFDLHQRGYQGDLELNLLATQRWRGGQCCNLIESAGELTCGFNERRSRQRPLTRFAPEERGPLDQSCLATMTREQFRLVLGDIGEPGLKHFRDARVKRASRLAKQRPVGRVLHQRMLEQIARVGRYALPE